MAKGDYLTLEDAPPGSTIERRDDGRVFLWYPRIEHRETVSFTGLDRCETCGAPVGYPERDMATTSEALDY